eukprot:TRINITY_DN4426_c0_g1_i2.p1 TRINITY_DN4426_c0_g1~~TRINITY_DN4426_c0_g1_i2.p1  ORF type:complete len:260 (+),score=75.65 TRINITY_DN4426_c0_g1_i2:48-827(+)
MAKNTSSNPKKNQAKSPKGKSPKKQKVFDTEELGAFVPVSTKEEKATAETKTEQKSFVFAEANIRNFGVLNHNPLEILKSLKNASFGIVIENQSKKSETEEQSEGENDIEKFRKGLLDAGRSISESSISAGNPKGKGIARGEKSFAFYDENCFGIQKTSIFNIQGRKTFKIEATTNGLSFVVLSVHLSPSAEEQPSILDQFRTLMKSLKEEHNGVIILGDLNLEPKDFAVAKGEANQFGFEFVEYENKENDAIVDISVI